MRRSRRSSKRSAPTPAAPSTSRAESPVTGVASMAPRSLRLAVVPGDGIGPEVVAEGLKVLAAVAPRHDLTVETDEYDLGARRWHATGETLPDAVLAELRAHDAILLGAVG